MPLATIRNAIPSDAQRLSQLAERTFRDTFGAMNTTEDMDLHVRASYSETIQGNEIATPSMATLLCEQEENLIAFAQLRWTGAPPCIVAQSPGEIQRLYVAADWHSQGIAQVLMQACIEEMKSHGTDVIWLGVWERNPRAISFYKKLGFVEVGNHVFSLGHDLQRDIIMARSVVLG